MTSCLDPLLRRVLRLGWQAAGAPLPTAGSAPLGQVRGAAVQSFFLVLLRLSSPRDPRPPTLETCTCYEPYEIRAVWVYGDIRGSYEHRLYGYTVNQPYRRERAGAYGYTPKLYTAATRYGLAAGSGRRSSLPKFHDLAECGPRALAAQLRRRAPALRPVAVGRGPSRCALRAAPPAARCRAVRPEKDRNRDTPARDYARRRRRPLRPRPGGRAPRCVGGRCQAGGPAVPARQGRRSALLRAGSAADQGR